jgi:hypothetical protein
MESSQRVFRKYFMATQQEPGNRDARELSDALRHALEWSQDVNESMAAHKQNRKPNFVAL